MKKIAALLCALLLWTNQAYAAGISWWDGSTWQQVVTPYWWDGSTWRTIVDGYWWDGSAWQPSYSTVTVVASNVSGSGSGNSTSGLVTTGTPGTTTGGSPIGSPTFAWSYVSGDSGIAVSSASAQNPTWSETVTGVASGNTVTNTATWAVVATDPATGAASAPANITASVSWHNSGSTLAIAATGCRNDVNVTGPHTETISCEFTSTPSGGTGSYVSYTWSCLTGCIDISLVSGTVQNPTVQATLSTCGGGCTNSVSGTWSVTVTDSSSAMATSSAVSVELSITQTNT